MGDSRKNDPRKENLNKGNRNNVVGEAEKEHNPIKVDLFYGLGTLGSSTIGFVISSWLLYFYVPPDGSPLVPVALYGVAILVGRGISALITPFVGYLSDNSHILLRDGYEFGNSSSELDDITNELELCTSSGFFTREIEDSAEKE